MGDNIKLITKNRIDIVIGIEYVDFYENKYNTEFFIDLYIKHKYAFNGLEDKQYRGKKQHLERFNTIINGIKDEQTNTVPIPVHKYKDEYWVIDGFHRSSALSYYNLNKNLEIISYQTAPCYCWYPTNIYFFKHRGYELKYCNYTMYNFLKNYQKDFSCIILYPNDKSLHENFLNEINKDIIYHIDIPMDNFKNNFKNNFVQLLYYTEEWCKNGVYKYKASACFNNGNKLKVYFIEKKELNILVDLKKKIRNYYNIGKHSIHIPDTQKECDSLLDLLNHNTLSFIDKAPSLYINFPNFNKLFEKLKQFCKENNIDTKKICITSSSVLSVYGIRECEDIDLFTDKKYVDIFKKTPFDNHNKYTIDKHYSKHFEDIIYNPNNHFYFQGIKFCNLNIVNDFLKKKLISIEQKDKPVSIKIKENINKFADRNSFDCCNVIDNLINDTNIDIGIVIVWDNNYNNKIVEEITKNNIELIYSKKLETTLLFTENLLREIHMKKPWWKINLKDQSKKRYNGNLTFHVFIGEEIYKIFRNIKNTIRNKNQLDKHIFHFSDPDCLPHIGMKCHCESDRKDFLSEAYKHINLLMNKNTLYFLKKSKYNRDLKIHTYFDEYCEFLSKNNLNSDNFIIDNGGVLALYGLRDAHDLDFLTTEEIRCKEKNVGCENKNHRLEYKKLGYSIKYIIENPENYFYHYNKKILDIKILKKFKFNRTIKVGEGQLKIRQKDINDYKMICDNFIA